MENALEKSGYLLDGRQLRIDKTTNQPSANKKPLEKILIIKIKIIIKIKKMKMLNYQRLRKLGKLLDIDILFN